MAQNTICLTIIQVETDPAMRGRMMGFVGMTFFGMLPLGSLLVGAVSQHIGAPATVCSQGIISIIIALFFAGFLMKGDKKGSTKDVASSEMSKVIDEYLEG